METLGHQARLATTSPAATTTRKADNRSFPDVEAPEASSISSNEDNVSLSDDAPALFKTDPT